MAQVQPHTDKQSLWTTICLAFPLHVWHESSSDHSRASHKPTLHVPSSSSSSSRAWCSSDPTALAYQVLFLLSGIDFDVVQQDSRDWWGPSCPFLVDGREVVGVKDLDAWISRRRRQEKMAPAPQESKLYATLVETTLKDAVALTQLLASTTTPPPRQRSLLSRLLTPRDAVHLSSSNTGRWTESVPGWLDAVTFLGVGGGSDGKDDDDEKHATSASALPANPDEIIREGVEAIHAIALRMHDGEEEWFLGSEQPTKLDAQLFALLHTILAQQQDTSALREAVLQHECLTTWTMRVYDKYVRDKEMTWRRGQSAVA